MLKPRATLLLTFIGVSAAIVAADGHVPVTMILLVTVTLLLGSAGVNGLTNYLDRQIDARMQRTRHRALPSKSINPPQKILPLVIALILIGLALAWQLHPLAFVSAVAGTIAATTWRKRATCIFPQGMFASCAPALIGWFAIKPAFGWELVLLCAMIAVWLPLHVWSLMISNREDYIGAGLTYFPMSRKVKEAVKVLPLLSLVLAIAVITMYFVGSFNLLYLIVASILSVVMVYFSFRLAISGTSHNAWRLYQLSTYPYLGLILHAIILDILLL